MSDLDVQAMLGYWPAEGGDITTEKPRLYDMRSSEIYAPYGIEQILTRIHNARGSPIETGLNVTGFALFDKPSSIDDWFNTDEVITTYYEECRQFARELTGASYAYTFDHLIRESGKQTSGGGTDGSTQVTGAAEGGGYVGAVHMDYTTNTTWHEYLALHGESVPEDTTQVITLNFWRPICEVVDDNPLAVCDARTIQPEDLFETVVLGYGADNYSWHNIGIETYNVKASDRQRWYYYPRMTRDEVLVFKSYDSTGVIGNTCAHGSFVNPFAAGHLPERKSIELRVLCFI